MNFNARQTHNRFDCEYSKDGGRHTMIRRVDLRIGYIITAFGETPSGFVSVQAVADKLNRMHKGANYTFNDIYPTLVRMRDQAGIVENHTDGSWTMAPKARSIYSKIEKKVRGV